MSTLGRSVKWSVAFVALALLACGGDPGQGNPGAGANASQNSAALVSYRLGVDVSGLGTITGHAGSQTIGCTAVSMSTICTFNVMPGDAVVLSGGSASNFVGFKVPYCQVNPCNWDDPDFAPPAYAWSKADYSFTVTGSITVSAAFSAPATVAPTTYKLGLVVSGPGSGTITGPSGVTCAAGSTCVFDITAGTPVTISAGGASNFVGFQVPYCQVNPCDWSNPDFAPPAYAWSTADDAFTMTGPITVSAKFASP